MEEYLYLIFLSECINIIFIRLILCLLFFEFDYLLIKIYHSLFNSYLFNYFEGFYTINYCQLFPECGNSKNI